MFQTMQLKRLIRTASLPILIGIVSGKLHQPSAVQAEERTPSSTACEMNATDRQWIDGALADWSFAELHELKLTPTRLSVIVLFDDHCQYRSISGPEGDISWQGFSYKSKVLLPNGSLIPSGVVSFAAPVNGSSTAGFFVMSLPSIWRSHDIQSGLGVERFMDAVLLHEMSHTRQFYFANPIIDALSARYRLGDEIGDDSIQGTFSKDPAYVKAYESERDLLYKAAGASTDVDARMYARQALHAMHRRRQTWFTGSVVYWNTVDDVFLMMEDWTVDGLCLADRSEWSQPQAAIRIIRGSAQT